MSESQPAKCFYCPNTSYTLNVIEQDQEIVLLCDDCLVEEPHKP
jgi:hypothetical protein